jgi:uncharacterized membrane protein
VNVTLFGLWSFLIRDIHAHMHPLAPNLAPDAQLSLVLGDPLHFVAVVFRTLLFWGEFYTTSFIGILGWLDTRLPVWLTQSYWLLLVGAALVDTRKGVSITWRAKAVQVLIISLVGSLFLVSFYLVWTPVGGDVVLGIQGRYLIPISPLFFLLLYNTRLRPRIPALPLKLLVVAYLAAVLATTASVLLHRYYIP